MRTMFIPTLLLMVCSLASAQATDRQKLPICENIYNCYVPEACTDATIGDVTDTTFNSYGVTQVKRTIQIFNKCPAFFRFHAFAKNWVHFSIESFDERTTSIVFRQKLNGQSRDFSCAKNDDASVVAKYANIDQKLLEDVDTIEQSKGNLRCTFVVKLAKSNEVFLDLKNNPSVLFEIIRSTSNIEVLTQETQNPINNYLKCDPSTFLFKQEAKVSDNRYTKVESKPNKYYCENSDLYKIEYKPQGKSSVQATISCEGKDFKVNGITMIDQPPLDVRCSADAKFFCKDPPKTKTGETKLQLETETAKPSEIKCPEDKPFLFINGKFFPSPDFECLNYGGTEYWTVNKTTRLTPSGPETYCTDKINCILKYKIPDSHVHQGTFDSQNVPKCYEQGVLYVGNNKATCRCDFSTGDFKYTVNGKELIVDRNTKFECKYPVKVDEAKNKEDNTLLAIVGGSCIVVCIIAVTGTTFLVVWKSKKHIKEMNERHRKEALEQYRRDELKFKHFGYGAAEKKLLMKKNKSEDLTKKDREEDEGEQGDEKEDEEPKSAPCADPTLWNELCMDIACKAKIDENKDKAILRNGPYNENSHDDAWSSVDLIREQGYPKK